MTEPTYQAVRTPNDGQVVLSLSDDHGAVYSLTLSPDEWEMLKTYGQARPFLNLEDITRSDADERVGTVTPRRFSLAR